MAATILLMGGAKPHGRTSIRVGERHTETCVFALIALVEIKTNAQSLQVGIRMRGQHKEESLNEILKRNIFIMLIEGVEVSR